MMKTASRMMMAAAAASMALAPVAVQANTRASDGDVVYTTSNAKPGLARSAEGEELASGIKVVIALLAAALVGAGIYFITDSDPAQSPGT